MAHYPFASQCELCVANRARQDGHRKQRRVETARACISFRLVDNVMRAELTMKRSCAPIFHDESTGAMCVFHASERQALVELPLR